MKISRIRLLVMLAIIVSTLLIWHRTSPIHSPKPGLIDSPPEGVPAGIILTETQLQVPPPQHTAPLGESMLLGYASDHSTPQQDLTQIAHVLTSFLTLVKTAANYPLSANEEWSAALRGKRPGSEVWISNSSPVVDSQQRLIDRWQHPLHFHALGKSQWEIRSSGPDGQLFTADDGIAKVP